MEVNLSGKRALVTGSTRGIGYAIARRLAKDGACTIVNGRTEEAVAKAIETLRVDMPHGTFEAASGDLSDGDEVADVFSKAGDVDILVNNIGIFGYRPPFEVPDEAWMDIFRINVLTTARTIRHYGPRMRDKGWGRIVNIGSEAGVAPTAELVHYAASKAAVHALSRGYAQALARTGVTVNTLLVGPTAHPDATAERTRRAAAEGLTLPEYQDRFFVQHRPTSILGRYIEADEVAELVAFIVSDEAGFASGASWRADCGNLTSIS